MKTLSQKSDIEDIVLNKERVSVEFSLFLRKLVRILDSGFLQERTKPIRQTPTPAFSG
jgi:hypothetical protein